MSWYGQARFVTKRNMTEAIFLPIESLSTVVWPIFEALKAALDTTLSHRVLLAKTGAPNSV